MSEENCPSVSKIQYVKPKSMISKFADTILDKRIIFQVVKLDGTAMIYIHDMDKPYFTNLDVAMNTRFSSDPHATSLVGQTADFPGTSIASRLSKKLNKIVYLSLNITDTRVLIPLVEKRLFEEINQFPEKF